MRPSAAGSLRVAQPADGLRTRSEVAVGGVAFTVQHDRSRAEDVRTMPLAEPPGL